MTPKGFNRLDNNQKLMLLINEGEFISEIIYYGNKIKLYIVDSLYVEVFTNIHTNELAQIEVLEPEEVRLRLYAKDIDISELTGKD